jgi:hypothetical protein
MSLQRTVWYHRGSLDEPSLSDRQTLPCAQNPGGDTATLTGLEVGCALRIWNARSTAGFSCRIAKASAGRGPCESSLQRKRQGWTRGRTDPRHSGSADAQAWIAVPLHSPPSQAISVLPLAHRVLGLQSHWGSRCWNSGVGSRAKEPMPAAAGAEMPPVRSEARTPGPASGGSQPRGACCAVSRVHTLTCHHEISLQPAPQVPSAAWGEVQGAAAPNPRLLSPPQASHPGHSKPLGEDSSGNGLALFENRTHLTAHFKHISLCWVDTCSH